MKSWSFPFLRHGVGVSNTFSLWVAAADPEADLTAFNPFPGLTTSGGGSVIVLRSSRFKKQLGSNPKAPALAHSRLDSALRKLHQSTALGLVVRDNRVGASEWHRETVAAPQRVFDALERLINAPGPYLKGSLPSELGSPISVSESMLAALSPHSLASMIRATCRVMIDSASGKKAKAVLEDQLAERLPGWLGHDFTVDLVVRERLSLTLSRSPTAVEMPQRFYEQEALSVSHSHAQAHRGRSAIAATLEQDGGGIDWARASTVKRAIAAKELRRARDAFLDTDPRHVETMLALTHEERLALITLRDLSTLIANAATNLMLRRRFADALTLYDAAIEGRLEAGAAANPLYAVQDDNNHLGVDPARSRRYLERCLPHGPANPAIFLNGAFVAMELEDHGQAIELLKQAKAHGHGHAIKQHKNERLFVPLQARADFKALMR